MTNKIPEELTCEFTPLEEKIADVLMTYTKNRSQKPHPFYYKALAAAVKHIFIHTEEVLVDESFENGENTGDFRDLTFSIRDFPQTAVASYIESRMLRPLITDALISENSYFGEKVAIKYGFFGEEQDETMAVTSLLLRAYRESPEEAAVDLEQFAEYLIDILNNEMKKITSWTEKDAEELFDFLKGLRPAWAETYQWHIVSLDLYEWFCLKNNLTFRQFRNLFDNTEFEDKKLGFRIAAYALRYPSYDDTFNQALIRLQKCARDHPEIKGLEKIADEENLYTDTKELEHIGNITARMLLSEEEESEPQKLNTKKHRDLLDSLKKYTQWHKTGIFTYEPDVSELQTIYQAVCSGLCITPDSSLIAELEEKIRRVPNTPASSAEDNLPSSFFEDAEDTKSDIDLRKTASQIIRNKLEAYRTNTDAWVIKTTFEPFADCMNETADFEELCAALTAEKTLKCETDLERIQLMDTLKTVLAGFFEEKLANHLAETLLCRLAEENRSLSSKEKFALRYAVARRFEEDSRDYDSLPRADRTLAPVAERLRKEFPENPVIANQLAAKIYLAAFALQEYDNLNPVPHHYFLAAEIHHLLNAARDSVWMQRGGRKTVRYRGIAGNKIYADDTGIVTFLYRSMCEQFRAQPCADVSLVM